LGCDGHDRLLQVRQFAGALDEGEDEKLGHKRLRVPS
jgi:hypothetical protein